MKPVNLTLSPESTPTVLKVVGAVILAGTLGYVLLVPAPKTGGADKRELPKRRQIAAQLSDAKKQKEADQALFAQRKSQLAPDAIGPNALSRITGFAQANALRLVGFRPQRTIETAAGLTEFPYQVAIEGPYPAVVKLSRMIEERTTDIAVLGLQATSSDSESDRVAATITIAIFRDPPPKPRTNSSTSGGGVTPGTPNSTPTGTGSAATPAGTTGGATNG